LQFWKVNKKRQPLVIYYRTESPIIGWVIDLVDTARSKNIEIGKVNE
jgi:hypothetical protein